LHLTILVLLGLMALKVSSNSLTLRRLDRSLRAVEKKQLRKYGVPRVETNAPPR